RGIPENMQVPHIEPSPHDASVAYIVFDNHRQSDSNTYVYRVEQYGRRWISLGSKDLRGHAYSVKQDPVDADLLFLGTVFGLFVTLDGGDNWFRWTQGVPASSVRDIAIQTRESDLVVATHGRGIFIIDDYGALRNLAEKDFSGRMMLLSVTDGQQYRSKRTNGDRLGEYRAPNEPYGAMITFMLSGSNLPKPETVTDTNTEDGNVDGKFVATVKISNADGRVIRMFEANVHQGINRVVWDMGLEKIRQYPSERQPSAQPGPPPRSSVHALPGRYSFTVSFEQEEIGGMVSVLTDPRFDIAVEDRQANFDALMQVADLQERNVTAIERIRDARRDAEHFLMLAMRRDGTAGMSGDGAHEDLSRLANEMNQALDEIEYRLWSKPGTVEETAPTWNLAYFKITKVMTHIGSHWGRPTQGNLRNIIDAQNAVQEAEQELGRVMANEVAAFRNKAAEMNLDMKVTQ
ncbi:MAG: hypothetical protein ACI88G_001589, partial [Woeseiaceae bacterium]